MVYEFFMGQKILCSVIPSGLASVRMRVAVVFIFVNFVGSVKDDFKSSVGNMKCLIYYIKCESPGRYFL